MRPKLTKDINESIFKDFYWLKEELQSFGRGNGISATGSKVEISNRIETFLRTGKIEKTARVSRVNDTQDSQVNISLDTIITENHRYSQDVRAFFKTVIP